MAEIPRAQVVVYAVLVAAVAFLGARALRPQTLGNPERSGAQADRARTGAASGSAPDGAIAIGREDGGRVYVHVAGAVRRPGVYRLGAGRRVADAVRRAGGGLATADLDQVNLAAKVSDGQQVLVPRRAQSGTVGAAPATPGAAVGATPGAGPTVPINLNTATLEQLDTLDGVGPATARKILDERTRRGGFRSVDDLGTVPGIGPKRLAAIRPRVRV